MTKNDELKLRQGLRELGYSNETIKNCIEYEKQKQERRKRIYPSKNLIKIILILVRA